MNLSEEANNGVRAERLMQELDPYLSAVREAIVKKWENSPVADRDGQHELRLMRKLLNDLEANIKTAIESGKLATVQIQQESIIDRAKRAARKFA